MLEIQPVSEVSSPMPHRRAVVFENGVLDVRDVRGEVGTTATLLTVPTDAKA